MQPSAYVLGELAKRGATQFARLVDLSPKVTGLLNRNAVKLMLVPLDAALQTFTELSKVPLEKWTTTAIGQEILENHLSTALNFRDPGTASVPALNGNPLPLDKASVQNFQITEHIIIGDIAVYFIRVVLVDPDQLRHWNSLAAPAPFSFLNFDKLVTKVTSGQIRGKELIALCDTSQEANRLCSRTFQKGRTIFDWLLKDEFGVTLPAGQDARQQYLARHK